MEPEEAEGLLARILGETVDEGERTGRTELARRLGGLPLALDIAACQMAERGWGARAYLERLGRAPSVVEELSLPLASRREESVARAFALSYEGLEEGLRGLFRALGVMAEGGFTARAVAGVWGRGGGEVERGLAVLGTLSLVRPGAEGGRCELHPLLAEYSRELARAAGEWEGLRDGHLAHYVAYAEEYTRDYPALEGELANLMAAAEWSWESGENQGVQALVDWLYVGGGEFLDLRGHGREAVRLLGWAAEAARRLGDRRGEGNRLGNLGNAYSALGEVGRAIEYYEQALAIAREIGDRRGVAFRCWNLGLLYEESDPARAAELMQVCVDYEREIGHPDAEEDAERVAALRKKSRE